ncbi:MAG: hypothetical protein Greene041679_316 [Parcubacteria group bacterium Greene0416_79]|nr:MAG: hypothetical protein Greene041679_316 [Parcubacteria group bacterium Greene0416_79]
MRRILSPQIVLFVGLFAALFVFAASSARAHAEVAPSLTLSGGSATTELAAARSAALEENRTRVHALRDLFSRKSFETRQSRAERRDMRQDAKHTERERRSEAKEEKRAERASRVVKWHEALKEKVDGFQKKLIARRVLKVAARLLRAAERLQAQQARASEYVERRLSQGRDLSEARGLLSVAEEQIREARMAVEAFPVLLQDRARKETRGAAEKAIHAATQETREALKAANQTLLVVLASLKKERGSGSQH